MTSIDVVLSPAVATEHGADLRRAAQAWRLAHRAALGNRAQRHRPHGRHRAARFHS